MRILIIEADTAAAAKMRELLEAEGHLVLSVLYNGMAALQALNTYTPDLVLLDMQLSNHWAETIVHAIGKKFEHRPQIVLCTTYLQEARYLLRRNPDMRYLLKPVQKNELLALLKPVPRTTTNSTPAESVGEPMT